MHIEYLRVRGYRVFRDVEIRKLGPMAVFVGANGTGKSTLFDLFGFLRDALQDNVHVALIKRGGYKEVVSRGQDGPIEIMLKFREAPGRPLVTYELVVGFDAGRALVEREVLMYRRRQQGKPWRFLDFKRGRGQAIVNEADQDPEAVEQREEQALQSPDILAIKALGQFERFRVAATFRDLVERWHLSDLHVSSARPSQEHGHAEHLSPQGENLALVARYLHDQHPEQFARVIERMTRRVPGITQVEATETVDGRLVLRFQDGAFRDPFIARYVSDGTLKMFAYLLLLHDPRRHPLVCLERPERHVHPAHLGDLAEDFRAYGRRGGQVFISTHSPAFLDGCQLDEVYWLRKAGGATTVQRAADDPQLGALEAAGDPPGVLWTQNLFGDAHP